MSVVGGGVVVDVGGGFGVVVEVGGGVEVVLDVGGWLVVVGVVVFEGQPSANRLMRIKITGNINQYFFIFPPKISYSVKEERGLPLIP